MPERPNLLFIFTDQQRADTMACYGNRMIETPNLNRLSDESFVFENAYVSAPICSPSRSTIMTGLWPHTSGVLKNNFPLDPIQRRLSLRCCPPTTSPATTESGIWATR